MNIRSRLSDVKGKVTRLNILVMALTVFGLMGGGYLVLGHRPFSRRVPTSVPNRSRFLQWKVTQTYQGQGISVLKPGLLCRAPRHSS